MPSSDLKARLSRLEEERGVLRTLHAYGHALDYGDEEGWVDCFTEDGSFDVRGRLTYLVSGREQLREFVSRHSRAPDQWHKHLLVEPVIEVDGDAATSVAYFAVIQEIEGEPALRVFGRYRDRLVKESDGRWRIRERIVDVESIRPGPPLVQPEPQRRRS